MNSLLSINRKILSFGIPFFLLVLLAIFIKTSSLVGNNTMDFAISLDLLLSIPLVYFLLIRKTEIPNTTVVPVMIIGLLLGTYLLPIGSQTYLSIFKTWAFPFIELSVLAFTIIKVKAAINKYKNLEDKKLDFYIALKSVVLDILPKKIALLFATEVAVFYYAFFKWRKISIMPNEFTYHKNSGTPALFGALVMLIGIETFAFHLLLAQWSLVAAWILSILSIYTAIQFLGFAKSMSKRPISINEQGLSLKYGIMNEVDIDFSEIEKVEFSSKVLEKNSLTRTLSPLGELETHNVILYLKSSHHLMGIYGIKKEFNIIGFYVDESKKFKEKIEIALLPFN